LRGHAGKDGAPVLLEPTDAAEVVQTQRYLFPAPCSTTARKSAPSRLERGLQAVLEPYAIDLKAAEY
jgi:hypothetical protein